MAFPKIAIFATVFVILLSGHAADATIGVNWGRQQTTKITPSMVVDLLMQNKVMAAKLYNTDVDLIKAFGGSGIEVTIGISNINDVNTLEKAREMVRAKITSFSSVNIKYVLAGNNAFAVTRFQKNASFHKVLEALETVQNALHEVGQGDKIKAIISHSFTGVLQINGSRPSDAQFTDDLREEIMPQILKFNKQHNTPFVIDFFPIGYIYAFKIDPNFAFFDNKSTYVVTDINGFRYDNVFDFVYDSFVWAIKKVGYNDIKITVGQIGWPTDGVSGASAEAAERFWKGLLPKVSSNRGTPMRPGAPIDIYVHSLTDEKNNEVSLPFTRHWGIYRSNGEPKYKIDISGQGRDIYPTSAKGLNLMPGRWCVFNGEMTDPLTVRNEFIYACKYADCTSLSPGGSCSMLSYAENISYAFNPYFQNNFQAESTCKFKGFGRVVEHDPSRDGCVFSVEVVRGNSQSDGRKLHVHKCMLPVFLVLILFVLC